VAFFKKRPPDDEGPDNGKPNGDAPFEPQPEKAQKWFEHARTAAMSSNYDYALSCYANGLKLDPETMSAHDAMMEVAVRYMNKGGKPAGGREIRAIEESHPIGRFVAAEFAWMKDFMNSGLALKAVDAAVKAGQLEWGHAVASKVLGLMRRQKKVGRSTWLSAMNTFRDVHAFNEALAAGEAALALDPTDSNLDHELKNLSAQRAMDQGRYEDAAGQEGGFRGMVKDIEKQRELDEADRLSISGSAEERKFSVAERDYQENPQSPENISKYAQALKKQGTSETLRKAGEVLLKGFQDTGEYRFRMSAGDIEIDKARRRERALQDKLQQNSLNGELQAQYEQARTARLKLESEEYNERAERYPTDRRIRFQLGEIAMELGDFGKAMECFQTAKDEPRLAVRSSHLLGQCFAHEHWHKEAIEEFKEALAGLDVTDKDRELDIRYDLMLSLIEHARSERDADLAREARDICSNIARRNIGFRDIREKRNDVEGLLKEIATGDSPG